MKKFYIPIILIVFLSFIACSKDIIEKDIIVIIPPNVPKMKMHEISDLSVFSVYLKGELLDKGDSEVTETGIIISTFTNSTVNNNFEKIKIELDSDGKFGGIYPFLTVGENTTLYIKCYSINSQEVGYSNEIEFTTLKNKEFYGDVKLNKQSDVINFSKNKYNTINGKLLIEEDVYDLSPLSDLLLVRAGIEISDTSLLKTLNGLENIIATGYVEAPRSPQGLRIENNSGLVSLDGLNSLKRVAGEFYIINNNLLETIEGFENFEAVDAGGLGIYNCDNLKNTNGFDNINFIGDSVTIQSNNSLTEVSGFNSLIFIDRTINIVDNNSLKSISGFDKINIIEQINLESNYNLVNLDGFKNIETIEEHISIKSNFSLNDFSAFKNIKELQYLILFKNSNLTSLTGLESLMKIKNNIEITNNPLLSDFCALKPLILTNNYGSYWNVAGNLNNPTPSEIISDCN